ncbi:MAG: O-antigen ligase family protein [Treponema sp.]|nr:MAG: O-antigen ligase family protein [Treponema sp.]
MQTLQIQNIKFQKLDYQHIFKRYADYFIFVLLCLYSFVDCLTGIAKIIGMPSPGSIYKLLLMGIMVVSLTSYYSILIPLFFFTATCVSCLVYVFLPYTNFNETLSMVLRIILAPVIYVYLNSFFRNNKDSKKIISYIFGFNFYTLLVNQLFGILGFGGSTYSDAEDGFGIKGFFYDGNALAVVLLCFFVFYFTINKSKLKSFLLFLIAVMVATKTAILGIVLFFFIYSYFSSSRKNKRRIFLLFIIVVSVFLYLIFETDLFSYHVEKIKRMYELFDGHILDIALSGRSRDLQTHYKFYHEHFSLSQLLFGYGYRLNSKIIELDPFDTLFSYGLLIFIPVFFFYLYLAYQNRKKLNLSIFNLLYFFISLTSGHVWYNTSAALFFCLLNIYGNIENSVGTRND